MAESVPQVADYATLVFNKSPSRVQGVVTAITHVHGSFSQLAIIRRRDSMDSGLLGSRLGEPTSKMRNFAVPLLDGQLQARDNPVR